MKIVERNITDLIFAEYNPRKLTTEQYEHLKSSMLRFGIVDPIIINIHPDRKNIIIGGHQRAKIWKDLGNKKLPCVELKLEVEKERELNIRLNRNTGEWDWEILSELFDVVELIEWGFNEKDLLNLQTPEFDPVDESEMPRLDEKKKTKCPECGYEFEA